MKRITIVVDTSIGNEVIDLTKLNDFCEKGDKLTIISEGTGLVFAKTGEIIAGEGCSCDGSVSFPGIYMEDWE